MKKYSDWKLHNFIIYLIKDELGIDENLYLNTDEVQVESDGDTIMYYVPIEYGHNLADVKLVIYPDFTYTVTLY